MKGFQEHLSLEPKLELDLSFDVICRLRRGGRWCTAPGLLTGPVDPPSRADPLSPRQTEMSSSTVSNLTKPCLRFEFYFKIYNILSK